jgi:hypothetical protein
MNEPLGKFRYTYEWTDDAIGTPGVSVYADTRAEADKLAAAASGMPVKVLQLVRIDQVPVPDDEEDGV